MSFRIRPGLGLGRITCEVWTNNIDEVIPAGGVVCFDYSSGNLGYITKPTTPLLSLVAGIALEAILPNTPGIVVISGPIEALVLNDVAADIVIGELLVPTPGQWYLSKAIALLPNGTNGLILAAQVYPLGAVPVVNSKLVHVSTR